MKFKLEILRGTTKIAELANANHDVPKESLTMADFEKVIATEQFLEKLFGYRFHIMEDPHASKNSR